MMKLINIGFGNFGSYSSRIKFFVSVDYRISAFAYLIINHIFIKRRENYRVRTE